MNVYIVYDTDQAGTTIYHVASSREKAYEWLKRHALRFHRYGNYYMFPDVKKVEVDQEEELCI